MYNIYNIMKSNFVLPVLLGFLLLAPKVTAQIIINSNEVDTFQTAGEGDLYIDNDSIFYIGVQSGKLKELGIVTEKGVNDGDILVWDASLDQWKVGVNLDKLSASGNTGWGLTGSSINSSSFLGSTNQEDLTFKVNNLESGRISIFQLSSAFGYNSTAGYKSAIFGNEILDSGVESIAIGYNARSKYRSVSVGTESNKNLNVGTESVAIGFSSNSNYRSVAIGNSALANNNNSIAIGYNASATGSNAIAIGQGSSASQNNSLILGNGNDVGIGTSTPNNRLEINSGVANNSGLTFTNLTNTTVSTQNAKPLGIDATGKVVSREKASLTDNGDGTLTFSNESGTSDDITFNSVIPSPQTINTQTIWIDGESDQITSTGYTNVQTKSFILEGGLLGTKNAIRIVCYRRKGNSNQRIRLRYGGQAFFESGDLGNESARIEFIIFGNGSTSSQKAFMDDANTGSNGQKFGIVNVNSTLNQMIEIQIRKTGGNNNGVFDFAFAELLTIGQ